jgi:hypothetical protein
VVEPRRTLSKQSLRGQVSAKLTPEICINNASSNSRLTPAAGKPQPQIDIHRTVSRLFFLFFPPFVETTTKLHLQAKKLTETVAFELGTLCGVFLFYVVLFGFFPL